MENYKEMIEMFLPDKILNYFDIKSVRRVNDIITIRLIEKNEVPELPIEHRGKKISSKGFKDFLVDDFPLRGKRVKLELKRRIWQIEGVKELLKRDIPIIFPNTKLNKEFALFLKDADRARASRDIPNSKDIFLEA